MRVVAIQCGGILEGLPAGEDWYEEVERLVVGPTMLRRAATFREVADVAAFAASDRASSMTGTSFNITCGAVVD